ncbi:methylated-DNA--[protein]-cysteine S-methyltransferase [Kibdelosporangium phytohabitans]|uniref:Methylated-DNA--protein-cysteine methyltransferase n=1 Tax=Kibdelosporangium phytohabitans TaxID=860235 RepID=A0A0N9HZM9_9PSEU|nr:methylated-DNA--[protein]-cysteine S-methyltransferase [Kibdelosporangium phytohabitans]ALG08997.1 cysteine methyltransferase [Kibdelosporangium phytohabitans]MBE1469826.1 methylated-DNA-[protein]-cysteine S-methyltransferase [Kibdelosporangium phytohabitans]
MTDVAVGSLETPVGALHVAVTDVGLADVSWVRTRMALPVVDDPDRVAPVLAQLAEYFRGARRSFDVPIDWRQTGQLQREVLETLYSTVDYGGSVTYGELATRSGDRVPARGIGSIMGSNPVPIVVPCHRVVASDGLGGYSGGTGQDGLAVKQWLLIMEGALPPTLGWDPGHLAL